jgi:multidrug resistance efflux pump
MKIRFDKPEQKQRDLDKGLKVSYGSSKRALASWRWYLVLLIICSPLIFLFFKVGSHLFIVRGAGYIEVPQIQIRASENGYVKKLWVKPMQEVNPGILLCTLEQPELDQKEKLLDSELDYLMNNPARKNDTNLAASKQISIVFAYKQKEYMKKRLNDFIQLFNQGAATDAEVKTARYQYEASLAHINSVLMTGPDIENLENGRRIRQLALEKSQLKLQSEAMLVHSPVEGKISDILVTEGEFVSRGDLVITVIKNEKAFVNAYLAPEYIKYAEVGQSATIVFANGERVSARVAAVPSLTKPIPLDAVTSFGSRDREIYIQLEFLGDVNQHLMNGAPVEVVFDGVIMAFFKSFGPDS